MRPLSLKMQAFGSYGKEQVIDFEKPEQNLFLITGDTGSGKTTIFDAIVFAIYGESSSSSNKKDGSELQSQFVDFDMAPYVELTFREGKNIYTVRRVPKHKRPLIRGRGLKDVSSSVSLTMPDGTEFPQKETDKKLEEIVGLSKAQFMQVAMIAQGEFMDMLRAKSNSKKEIFRKLFDTEIFDQIVSELKRRVEEKLDEISAIRDKCQAEIAHVVVPEEYDKASDVLALKNRILSSQNLSVVDVEDMITHLERMLVQLKDSRIRAEKDSEDAQKQRDQKKELLTTGRNLMRSFEQKERALQELEGYQGKEQEIGDLRILAGKIRDAYEVLALYQRYADTGRNVDRMTKSLSEEENRLPELVKRCQEAEEQEKEISFKRERTLGEFSRTDLKVRRTITILRKIKAAKDDITQKDSLLKKAEEEKESAASRADLLEKQETQWRKQAEELKDVDNRKTLLKQEKDDLALFEEEIAEEKKQEKLVFERIRESKEARDVFSMVSHQFEQMNYRYEKLSKDFWNAQAGLMARDYLRPGRPCPVCGSLEHPAPCELPEENKDLTREALEKMKAEVEKTRTRRENAAIACQRANENMELSERDHAAAMEKLRQHMGRRMDEIPTKVSEQIASQQLYYWNRDLDKETAELSRDLKIMEDLRAKLTGIDERKAALKAAALKAAEAASEAKAAAERSHTALEGLTESGDYATEEEARQAYNKIREQRDIENLLYEKVVDKTKRRREDVDHTKALIDRYQKEIPEKKKELEARKSEYLSLMEQKDCSEDEWKKLTASYQKEDTDRFRRQAEQFQVAKTAAEARLKTASEAIGDQEKPDLSALSEAVTAAEAFWQEKQAAAGLIREEFKADHTVYDALRPHMEERGKVMEQHKKLEDLYNLLAGKVTGSRMDIETFVQRYYLERILVNANRRFRKMSGGQFELRMCELESAGAGKNRGLDLMVYSYVTGKEREIRTLSGGESFMAALSLALGMADQIQENSAAISLDMMFIDEGFGSLDDAARTQAVRVLQDMAEGKRLIGIISHVSELKQAIDDQLIVTKDEKGSHTRWQLS